MFNIFQQMLNHDERIQFTVTRKGDQLQVLIQPVMQCKLPDNTPDSIKNIHAALSMPLVVTTSPENLNGDFLTTLAEYAGVRSQGHSDLKEALSRIKEAGKQAKAETEVGKTVAGNESAKQAEQPSSTQHPETEVNFDKSLFG
ncbi:PRTRC system protein E [Methylomonas sp. AM2-LC]|uniref:PRTRC system protein E n=1 Tax=Methylomonas sp. AM2-LC TaxID=3153301 RepID=UPI003263C225